MSRRSNFIVTLVANTCFAAIVAVVLSELRPAAVVLVVGNMLQLAGLRTDKAKGR